MVALFLFGDPQLLLQGVGVGSALALWRAVMRSSVSFASCSVSESCLLKVDNYHDRLNLLRVIVYRMYIVKYSMMFT